MFCYHNENKDFVNPKFVLVILIYSDLVTHYNTVDNPVVHPHHVQHTQAIEYQLITLFYSLCVY